MAKTEQSSSRMDTVLKMLLIAFVSLLAFSSGVYFGKQMSDSDHQLKALESDFNTQSYAANAERETGGAAGDVVGEEEAAALSDKYTNGERNVASTGAEAHGEATEHGAATTEAKAAPAAHGAATAEHAAPVAKTAAAAAKPAAAHGEEVTEEAHAAPAAKGAHGATAAATTAGGKPDLSAAHKAAERVANNAAPTTAAAAHGETAKVAETRVPSSLPKTVGANSAVEFTVQVASYPTSEAAKEQADTLVKKGFPAFPVEATINGRTWYRVSVGSFKTMKDATAYRTQLLKQADLQNAIVQKITR